MAKKYERAIYLFNRDLRDRDNELLWQAARDAETVLAVFILTKAQVTRRNDYLNPRSIQFMAESLKELSKNININFYFGDTESIMADLVKSFKPEAMYNNSDVTPFATSRTAGLKRICRDIDFITGRDIFLGRHSDLLKQNGSAYLKFTPFYNHALPLVVKEEPAKRPRVDAFILIHDDATRVGRRVLENLAKPTVEQTVFAPGRKAALAELRRWASSGVNYGKSRDVLHLGATSHLSAYLHFGILGPVEVMNYLRGNQNRKEFLRQLLWREFYLHIVWKQHTDYSKKSRTLKMNNHVHWRAPGREFKMWTLGQTGCPIVDAGMRELAATGYMQNRARMIVAMYLIYHLRLDWRLGEMHFARELTDYDYCNNLGGWLWCAGWEVYSNEWFRPFSMASQMERFDPEAKYVTRWCPELRQVEPRDLWDWSSRAPEMAKKYPRVKYADPLVIDMTAARAAGIEAYRRAHS